MQLLTSVKIPRDGKFVIKYKNDKPMVFKADQPNKKFTDADHLMNSIKFYAEIIANSKQSNRQQQLESLLHGLKEHNELNESEQRLKANLINKIKIVLGEKVEVTSVSNDVPGLRLINAGVKLAPRGKKEVEDYRPCLILGDFVYYKPKPAGIEPGFLGFLLKDVYAAADQYFKLDKTEVDKRLQDPEQTKILLTDLETKGVPVRFQKQDYKDPDKDSDQVGPDEHDLQRTNTVKAFAKVSSLAATITAKVSKRFAKKSITERNLEAILETLSTAIAGLFMKVQQQDLLQSSYEDGREKYVTSAVWQTGFSDFTKQHIAGDNNQGRLVRLNENGEKATDSQGNYFSDNTMVNWGAALVLAILFNDYDFSGSKGGNKGRVGNVPFGIDYGHGLRSENKIVTDVGTDCSLPKLPNQFKNFSYFSDTNITEKYQGLLILQKLRTGKMSSPEVLAEYPAEFQEMLRAIEPYADTKVFDAFLERFSENSSYVEGILDAKKYYLDAADKLLDLAKDRINLSPRKLEFIDHLEMLCSGTTQIFKGTQGEKVKLSHLQKTTRIAFEPTSTGEGFFTVTAKEGKTAKELFDQYIAAKQIDIQGVLQDDGSFLLSIPEAELIGNANKEFKDGFYKLFSEKKIATYKEQALPKKVDYPQSLFFTTPVTAASSLVLLEQRPSSAAAIPVPPAQMVM